MLGKPTQGSMIALKRVTRYLKGTRDFVNKPELNNEVGNVVRLDGYSDSDWAGLTDRKSPSVEWFSLTERSSNRSAEDSQ